MLLTTIALVSLPLLAIFFVYKQYTLLHRSIPGPLAAKFTNLYRLLRLYNKRDLQQHQLNLHRQHASDLIRLGPNTVSVTGTNYISQIYAINLASKLPKSDYYATFQNIVNGRRAASLVAMTDETYHARTKRLVAHAYSLSNLVEFEPLVDSTTKVLLDTLDARSQRGASVDFAKFLQYYAFDVMGELTFSRRLGFIESGEDVNGIIRSINANFDYFSVIGQMPWLDEWIGKNPLYVKYFRKQVSSPILQFAQSLLQERLKSIEEGGDIGKSAEEKPDFLARFLAAREKGAEIVKNGEETEPMTDGLLLSFLFGNINAGSDTIAATLRAVFYYLLKNPGTLKTLREELETAIESGNFSLPSPTWHESQSEHCEYLRAVIKEALRLWPALSLSLERKVVDPAGLKLTNGDESTTFLPTGTIVGINPWVLHRDARTFDPNFAACSCAPMAKSNVDDWDPARWLEGNKNSRGNSSDQLKTMEHSLLTFGGGKRSCLGKNIAMMELLKVVPAIIVKFPELQFADDGECWTVKNAWVLGQTGLNVKLQG